MKPIIEITNLSKKYPITHDKVRYGTLRDSITNFVKHPFGRQKISESFWALKDINLTIDPGETIGVIGKNGAGKSTLLKIISGITKPTDGKVKLYGHVSSLLEIGTGFHPELTGKENIYLNGVILGMTRKEVTKKFDEIVSFANIEKFLDTPIKHYSSGMYVRLAFAIAAHLEPDILIVDEVLAVGDTEFQKKCLGKMEDISKEGGRTVIFVSHDMSSIQNLCNKTVYLENGKISKSGKTEDIIDYYLGLLKKENTNERKWTSKNPGNENIRIDAIRIIKKEGSPVILAEDPLIIEVDYEILKPIKGLQLNLQLKQEMQIIFESADIPLPEGGNIERTKGKHKSSCVIPANFLNSNDYTITLIANIPYKELVAKEEEVLSFSVSKRTNWSGGENQPGMIRPKLDWKITDIF